MLSGRLNLNPNGSVGWKPVGRNLIRRYRQGLKMSEIEKMFFDYEGLRLKIVGLRGAGASLDIDSTKDVKKFRNLYL